MQCSLFTKSRQPEEEPTQWYFNRRPAELIGLICKDADKEVVAMCVQTNDDGLLHFSTILPANKQFDGIEYVAKKDLRPEGATLQ